MNVTFKTAQLAKDKNFSIPCRYYYDVKRFGERPVGFFGELNANRLTTLNDKGEIVSCNYYSAPYQYELQKWLREVHNIQICVDYVSHSQNGELLDKLFYQSVIDDTRSFDTSNDTFDYVSELHNSYEEALEDALYESLKLI